MKLVGDYRYGTCVLDGVRYAIIKNHDIIRRIRRIGRRSNPIIWEKGDMLTEQIIQILWKVENYGEEPRA